MALTKWTPTSNLAELRRLGKTNEELGELSAVVSRCIIQGINETDPNTKFSNRARLEAEIADVLAQIECTIKFYKLDKAYIAERKATKIGQMQEWEAMFK
jgi:NTP pyrophosphatase (non-canonical NTP hydrolase)